MKEKSMKSRNSKWTEERIFKAINLFIKENGRLPYIRELDDSNSPLPTHQSIKNRCSMTVTSFYNTYYKEYTCLCKSYVYHLNSKQYWLEDFETQYRNMDYPSQEKYDKQRKENTPSSQHLIKLCGYENWSEMIKKCGLIKKKELSITINHNQNISENELKNITQILSQMNARITQK